MTEVKVKLLRIHSYKRIAPAEPNPFNQKRRSNGRYNRLGAQDRCKSVQALWAYVRGGKNNRMQKVMRLKPFIL
ncbi:MAG: hypothetical protein KJ963_01555 [Bacteroidetes bacterium]|nr:hypothetical protein [Bacteroidota bacterium]MBU1422084.1 hypothetical protein [Bacteroidota bacterium]MBU2635762.1 hypothetical protein [Bacteroidota bacterium]